MAKREGDPRLAVFACDLLRANTYVRRIHRHHPPVQSHKFSLGVMDDAGQLRGVVIVSRPSARLLDDGWTAEVTRVATDGCRNACSALYGAAWRTARAMGYRRMVTYTLPDEGGASLRGAGWRRVGDTNGGGTWSRPSRWRRPPAQAAPKTRWEVGHAPPYPVLPDFGRDDGVQQLELLFEKRWEGDGDGR